MERLGIENIHNFLTENYNLLSNFTKADDFLTWLRNKRVLTQDDQEEICAKTTTRAKAAYLIDMVMLRGKEGFIAYMEVIEWVYPDIFFALTNITASEAPHEFLPENNRKNSVMLLKEMSSCMSVLLEDNLDKKVNIDKLNKAVSALKIENDKVLRNMDNLTDKLHNNNDRIEELLTDNKKLSREKEILENEKRELIQNLQKKSNQLILLLQKQISPDAKEKNVKPSMEEYLKKMNVEMNENDKENEKLKNDIKNLLDLNKRYLSDLQKAQNANHRQRRTITDLKNLGCKLDAMDTSRQLQSLTALSKADKRKGAIG